MLPTGDRAIVRVEELAIWSLLALQEGSTTTYIPRQNTEAERIAGVQVAYDFNKVLRAVSNFAPAVTNNWNASNGTPLWKNIETLSNIVIPEDYTG